MRSLSCFLVKAVIVDLLLGLHCCYFYFYWHCVGCNNKKSLASILDLSLMEVGLQCTVQGSCSWSWGACFCVKICARVCTSKFLLHVSTHAVRLCVVSRACASMYVCSSADLSWSESCNAEEAEAGRPCRPERMEENQGRQPTQTLLHTSLITQLHEGQPEAKEALSR